MPINKTAKTQFENEAEKRPYGHCYILRFSEDDMKFVSLDTKENDYRPLKSSLFDCHKWQDAENMYQYLRMFRDEVNLEPMKLSWSLFPIME